MRFLYMVIAALAAAIYIVIGVIAMQQAECPYQSEGVECNA